MASSTDPLFALGFEEDRIASLPDSLTWSPENSIFATGSQPVDLTGFAFDIVPGSANAGDTIAIAFRVQNSGDFASGPFQVSFYLSQDAGIGSSGDFPLGTFSIGNVPALSNDTVYTVDITLPGVGDSFWQGDDRYYIGLAVDSGNTVPESNERNNSSVGLLIDYDIINVNNTQAANLQGKSFNLFPEPLTAGGIFNFDFEIINTGGATGTPFNVAFYLSNNSTISTTDFLLTTTTISALAANDTTGLLTLTNNLSLPGVNDPFWSGDGTYYVGMIVDSDNVVTESNETDNRNTGLLVDYDDVVVTSTRIANLQGKSFNLFPEPLTAGGIFNFDFEITNTGGATGTPFNVAFYLSSNSTISTTDFLLTTTTLSALAANSTTGLLTLTNNLSLPGVNDPFWNGDGTYYVGMIVDSDNVVAESDETDNRNTGLLVDYDDVLVTGTQLANLKGNAFNLNPEPLRAGGIFNFDFEIINTGGATGTPFNVAFYLSNNSTISSTDLLLDTVTISALAANSTTGLLTLTNSLALPGVNDPFWSGDGTYYVGMIVDSDNIVAESNEADNRNTGLLIDYDDVVITDTQLANLRGNFFDLNPEPLSAGSLFNFDFEVINTGGPTGAPFQVSFYLSQNSTITTSDLFLETITLPALGANATTGILTLTNDLLLPGINDPFWNGDGTYYVGMIVDSGNAIAESNGSDNSNTGFLIDYDDVVIAGTSAVGTRLNDDFVGSLAGDTYFGLRGDDDIDGRGGNDGLYGDRGDDNLFGGFGSDYLDGGSGDDWLWGVEISAALPGAGEIDVLVGNFGADRFYLGDSTRAYYKSANLVDYAVIADFNPLEDTIVLSSAVGYSLQQTSGNLPAGIGIVDGNDLVGVVQGVSSLNLNASYFLYV